VNYLADCGKKLTSHSKGTTFPTGTETTEGNQEKSNVTDISAEQLQTDILKELKKMNLYLSLMTDTTINNAEVE